MRTPFMIRTVVAVMLCVMLATEVFAHPGSGIVVDKDGQVFFTDTGRGVWKIDVAGSLTYLPASRFHWLAIDEAGSFAESQKSFGEWFERVTPQGFKPVLIISSDFPLTTGKDGNIYYANTRPGRARIIRRTPGGTESVLASNESFPGISDIAAGPDGSIYVTDASRPGATIIQKITTNGKLSVFAGADILAKGRDRAVVSPPEAEAGYCRGLAVDLAGTVYVASTGDRRVIKVTSGGSASTILQTPAPWSPTGVTVFRGEVYVLEWQDVPLSQTEVREAWIPRVRKIGRDGKVTTLATISREPATPAASPSASPPVAPATTGNDPSNGVYTAVMVGLGLAVVVFLGVMFANKLPSFSRKGGV